MNLSETTFAKKLAKRHKITVPKTELETAVVKYTRNRNFTKAVIFSSKGLHVGVAKRNPNDTDNLIRGREIALRDALQTKPIK